MKDSNSINNNNNKNRQLRVKRWSYFFTLLIFWIGSNGLTACNQNKVSNSGQKVSTDEIKINRADSITLLISKNGHTQARLKTKEFLQNDGSQPPYLDMKDGLTIDFFNTDLKVESTLKAQTARFYPHNNNILIKDNVTVINTTGDTLRTELLVWNNQLQKFFSDVPVTISRAGSTSYGTSLEANKDLSWIRIHNQRGTLPVESDQLPQD
ncbi:MAG TPA: LPS export ABC transporter periplasmic protein LptC [Edaphocola sp.]|nr:LPS export ABC transporter periplasmic protein LptC [Edaphocola sp.]